MDEWIDSALSSYVDAEPQPGMEQRILARARASKTRFAPWLLVAAAVCALCVGIVLWPREQPPIRQIDTAMALPRMRSGVDAAMAPVVREPRRRALPLRLPKRQMFPAPVAAPNPELELARLSLENPELAKTLLARHDTGEPKPIQIEPLSIKLLDED
jgi:hypothetical protein